VKKLIVVALMASFLAVAGIGCTKETSKASIKATEAGAGATKTGETKK